MTRALRAAPATVPRAAVVALCVFWAFRDGGYEVRLWGPGLLVVLALVAITILVVPHGWRELATPVVAAAAALIAYCAWSFASIGWADDPGAALEGATRTALYACAFCLFALWPQRAAPAAGLLGLWLSGLALLGIVLGVRLLMHDGGALFSFDRLKAPTGYPNASADLLAMAVLPAVVLSAARAIPWWGRGLAAAVAVELTGLVVLTVSRGAVYSTPVAVFALLVLLPGRLRHLYAVLGVGIAVASVAPRLLDVSDAAAAGDASAALSRAVPAAALAALLAGVVAATLARVERRRGTMPVGPRATLAARGGVVVVLGVGLVGGLVVAGNPIERAEAGWQSFKGGYADNDATANRLVGGLGSARYDFYRVGLDAWTDHPVAGIGADNFYERYLRQGASTETPRYPHSVEIRALAQTGAVGALLLAVSWGAALVAAARAMRSGSPLRRTVAGAATMAFVFWLVHGSVDWFWEWPGLGLPAFSLLGLAAGLAQRPSPAGVLVQRRTSPVAVAALGVLLVVAAPAVAVYGADREQRRAATHYGSDPLSAYADLRGAARINPLSSAPDRLTATIALRYGDLPRAAAAFTRALDRAPNDAYAQLESGAIASARGERAVALRELERAAALAPRDALTREALGVVRSGGTVDVDELNRRILSTVTP